DSIQVTDVLKYNRTNARQQFLFSIVASKTFDPNVIKELLADMWGLRFKESIRDPDELSD
ncbi:MAG: hypothetical protein Q9164_007776, partial [Protoblastenia rupestris]